MAVQPLVRENLYDEGEFKGYGLPLNPNLSQNEIIEAEYLRQIMFGLWAVTGPRGSGKDLFTHTIAYKVRRFFGVRILLDHRPKRLFGGYTFFDPHYLLAEVKKMARQAGRELGVEKDFEKWKAELANATDAWLDEFGEVTFQDGFLVLGELKNYWYKRRPHNPLGVLLGRIVTAQRHLNLVIAGSTPFENELDEYACLQYATCFVSCAQMISDPSTCQMTIRPKTLVTPDSIISNITTKALPYEINGKQPRPCLGLTITSLGTDKLRAGQYSIMTDFERKVLATYAKTERSLTMDSLVASNGWDIDDVDAALKRLINFGYLAGPGYFDIFNSQNFIDLQPSLNRRREAE